MGQLRILSTTGILLLYSQSLPHSLVSEAFKCKKNNMHQKVALKLGLIFSHCAGSSLLADGDF